MDSKETRDPSPILLFMFSEEYYFSKFQISLAYCSMVSSEVNLSDIDPYEPIFPCHIKKSNLLLSTYI